MVQLIAARLSLPFLALVALGVSAPHGGPGVTVNVKPGQSIQAAIDAATYGTHIVVEAGTYSEQLTITTSGLTLTGTGAILVPPSSPVSNLCTDLAGDGTQAGICIAGTDVVLGAYPGFDHRPVESVGQPVTDTTVEGFQVKGFTGLNVAVVGAENTRIFSNTLVDGTVYGVLGVGSRNTHTGGNTIFTTGDLFYIGICTDDLEGVQTTGNRITGQLIGLCIQTSGSLQAGNDVSGCCTGAFVDPGVDNAQVRNNHFGPIDPRCQTEWPYNSGIILDGPTNAQVVSNIIEGQQAGGMAAGVAIVDDPSGAVSSNNVVRDNIFINNDVDIFLNTTGTGNTVTHNQCTTSVPASLCGA